MTTPLFLLRCVQLGISIRDLDLLTIGLVNDMFIESRNDDYNGYSEIATQSDYDLFVTIQSPENLYRCTKEKIRHPIESKPVKKVKNRLQ